MYKVNELVEFSKYLEKYDNINLDTDYKTDLFRGHLDAAKTSLSKAGSLLGRTDVFDSRSFGISDQMVSILIIMAFILLMFFIVG